MSIPIAILPILDPRANLGNLKKKKKLKMRKQSMLTLELLLLSVTLLF